MSSHIMRCREELWFVTIIRRGFRIVSIGVEDPIKIFESHWNAVDSLAINPPRWLAISWVCCEVDHVEGARFASAILEANSGDDTPALIACDWLEERGIQGELSPETVIDIEGNPVTLVEGWVIPEGWRATKSSSRGSLASWGREVIRCRCLECGRMKSPRKPVTINPSSFVIARDVVGARIPRGEPPLSWGVSGWQGSDPVDLTRIASNANPLESRRDVPICSLCGVLRHEGIIPLAIPKVIDEQGRGDFCGHVGRDVGSIGCLPRPGA